MLSFEYLLGTAIGLLVILYSMHVFFDFFRSPLDFAIWFAGFYSAALFCEVVESYWFRGK